MPLLGNLTNDRGKRWTSEHQPSDLTNVLHPPVEVATDSGNWLVADARVSR
jgi:hypothetical protein